MKTFLVRTALAFATLVPLAAAAQVSLSITLAPPPLPYYAQPPVPGDGYIWVPGYWAWNADDSDYYWVPATWVLAPGEGELWTPGWWDFQAAGYLWHAGYWGRSVGYYGGINYGYGYSGTGYQGGRWDHGSFRYNRAVSHIDAAHQRNSFSAPPSGPAAPGRTSFHGGAQGTHTAPTASQRRVPAGTQGAPTPDQVQHEHQAVTTPAQRASVSHGAPPVAATPRPSAFVAPGVERARPTPPPREQALNRPQPAGRPGPEARPEAQPRPEPQARPEAPARPEAQRPERAAPAGRGEPRQEEPRR